MHRRWEEQRSWPDREEHGRSEIKEGAALAKTKLDGTPRRSCGSFLDVSQGSSLVDRHYEVYKCIKCETWLLPWGRVPAASLSSALSLEARDNETKMNLNPWP